MAIINLLLTVSRVDVSVIRAEGYLARAYFRVGFLQIGLDISQIDYVILTNVIYNVQLVIYNTQRIEIAVATRA